MSRNQLEKPTKQICAFKAATYVDFSDYSQSLFHQFREIIGLPSNLPPCLEDYATLSSFLIHVDISINGSKRTFEKSTIYSEEEYGHLCFYCRPQSSLQTLFQDLNLGDQNHVELFCETNRRMTDFFMAPNIKAIGVHVECNCPQPQNVEALGLSMDNYEARSCTCLCGAQTCCGCLKEVDSTHSAGRASVHSSNLEIQIISSDTDGGGSSLVSVPSNSGLPMDVTNGRKFGILGGKDVLEDHNLSLMTDFKQIKDLLNQNGFASDEICQTMTADDDICGTYIQALQTQDQGPQRPVRMSTAPDSCSWRCECFLLFISGEFGLMLKNFNPRR
ncbi:hypothetical protein CMV_029957 [Castanea mollissima]|uniref:Uncharacterized protein n=1 Tax=Castanea mollissima TaxID=60419 RepID=A0A8J4V6W2_9ROSI|nr:hypothetical protein CMV_029957 [Castanea mollissima]